MSSTYLPAALLALALFAQQTDDCAPQRDGAARRRTRTSQVAPTPAAPTMYAPQGYAGAAPFAQVPQVVSPGGTLGVRHLPFTDADRLTEVNRTLDLMEQGGPFPFRQDGVVFANREGRLPPQSMGYYHEFTVQTPGLSHRGTRRIVRGDGGDHWYSDDHYRSFITLDPRRY